MMKTSKMKITLLLAVLTIFMASSAYASGGNFRIRIQDTSSANGEAVTISDSASTWAGDSSGMVMIDIDPGTGDPAPGTIFYQGTVGSLYTSVSLAFTQTDLGYSILSLSAVVGSNSGTPGSVTITFEDSGYMQPATGPANFFGSLTGPNSEISSDPNATLTGTNTSLLAQTWINMSNTTPNLGSTDGRATISTTLGIPGTAIAALNGGTQQNGMEVFTGATVSDLGEGGTLNTLSTPYSMFSQVVANFGGGDGTASFTLTSQTGAGANGPPLTGQSVPEPTSLMLLGSGLLGLGVLRKKFGKAA